MTRSLAALAVAGLFALTGCSSVSDDAKRSICISLGMGGYDFAVSRAQEFVDVSAAADAVRQSANDRCPQYLDNIPASS